MLPVCDWVSKSMPLVTAQWYYKCWLAVYQKFKPTKLRDILSQFCFHKASLTEVSWKRNWEVNIGVGNERLKGLYPSRCQTPRHARRAKVVLSHSGWSINPVHRAWKLHLQRHIAFKVAHSTVYKDWILPWIVSHCGTFTADRSSFNNLEVFTASAQIRTLQT